MATNENKPEGTSDDVANLASNNYYDRIDSYINANVAGTTSLMNLRRHQFSIRDFMNPTKGKTGKRILLWHDTGTGKTLSTMCVALMWIDSVISDPKLKKKKDSLISYSNEYVFGDDIENIRTTEDIDIRVYDVIETKTTKLSEDTATRVPNLTTDSENFATSVCIIGYTKNNIKNDILKYPSLGFIEPEVLKELDDAESAEQVYELRKTLKRGISKSGKLRFMGFGEFINRLFYNNREHLGDFATLNINDINEMIEKDILKVNEQFVKSFRNSLIIVDEVHNCYNTSGMNKAGVTLQYLLQQLGTNVDLILSTATPMSNTVNEIYQIASFLNLEQPDPFTYNYKEFATEWLSGRVSMITGDSHGKPKMIFKSNGTLPDNVVFDGVEWLPKLWLVNAPASMMHVKNKENNLGIKNLTYTTEKNETEVYKFKELIRLLNESVGKSFVYHRLIRDNGIDQIAEHLNKEGWAEWKSTPDENTKCYICCTAKKDHDSDTHEWSPGYYVVMKGDTSEAERETIKNVFNNKINNMGQLIKIIVGSKVLEEGTELLAVQNVFVCSPPINISTYNQIIGRVCRFGSHSTLPEGSSVTVYNMCIVTDANYISPDVSTYIVNASDYSKIVKMTEAVQEVALENTEFVKTYEDITKIDNHDIKEYIKTVAQQLVTDFNHLELNTLSKAVKATTKFDLETLDDRLIELVMLEMIDDTWLTTKADGKTLYIPTKAHFTLDSDVLESSINEYVKFKTADDVRVVNKSSLYSFGYLMKDVENEWIQYYVNLLIGTHEQYVGQPLYELAMSLAIFVTNERFAPICSKILKMMHMNVIKSPINDSLIYCLCFESDLVPKNEPYLGYINPLTMKLHLYDINNPKVKNGVNCASKNKDFLADLIDTMIKNNKKLLDSATLDMFENYKEYNKSLLLLLLYATLHLKSKTKKMFIKFNW